MRRLIALALLSLLLGSSAHAGKNSGGALVVHTIDDIVYTATANYCNTTMPTTCAELNPTAGGGVDRAQLLWLLAAFYPTANPGVFAIQFGIDHDLPANQGYITAFGPCGSTPLELRDDGWPETGFGDVVALGSPVTDRLWAFYWFAVRVNDSANHFGTRTYPSTNDARFVDDSNPPHEDLITRFGTIRFGGVTGSNTCPVPPQRGACCTSWGTCVENVDESTCEDANGVYQGSYAGDNTTCDGIVCGACCYALFVDENERRCANTTEEYCYDRYSPEGSNNQYTNPYWVGAGTRCTFSADSMDIYVYCRPITARWGACCLPDGQCRILTRNGCEDLSGFYGTDGSDCDPDPCLAAGACCFPDGHCEVLSHDDCVVQSGTFQGGLSTCQPNPCPPPQGACCYSSGQCSLDTAAHCAAMGGSYQGPLTSCDPNPCYQPTGACCDTWGTCTVETLLSCQSHGDAFQGDGTACEPNPCPQPIGACCFNAICVLVTHDECTTNAGVYGGDFTVCEPNPCPIRPGACCLPDGSCQQLYQAECLAAQGAFQGQDTACNPNPCPQPLGACCFHAICVQLTREDCVSNGGLFAGDMTTCSPNPCPLGTGACCMTDGQCAILGETDCVAEGGTYMGSGSTCDPNPCPQPIGACCFNEICTLASESECITNGGRFLGGGTGCDPNPCTEVPVRSATWGTIKALFR